MTQTEGTTPSHVATWEYDEETEEVSELSSYTNWE